MQDFDLKEYLAERKGMVDGALEEFFPAVKGLQQRVVEAARYSLFAGGKRLRPVLCLASAEVVGGSSAPVLPVACALEMIHTYSLVHDDLPAMDNDDFRRGRPTNHKVYGEAMAVLAGDALLTEAFGLMADARRDGRLPPERILEAIGILVKAVGYRGMIGGQVIDINCEKCDVDLATVEYMHIHKTGAFISGALEIGAVLGGGDPDQVKALKHYGHHLGLAFQITDDLLDVEGEAELMGKQPGSDEAKNKKTYPSLLGLARAKEAAREHVREALDSLAPFGEEAVPLRAVAEYLLVRRA